MLRAARSFTSERRVEELPRAGTQVVAIPPGHDIFVIGGRQFYYNAGVYYIESRRGSQVGFVVVDSPENPSSPNPIRYVREMSDYLAALDSVSMTCFVAPHEPDGDETAIAAPLKFTIHRMGVVPA